MANRIVVLSDGTWDTMATVMDITDAAYDKLTNGDIETCDLEESDILENKEIQ